MKVALHTLGCKLNQAESQALARQLEAQGYEVEEGWGPAQVCLLNTCAVTQTAEAKARHFLRMVRRSYPQALVIATGCYVRRQPEALRPWAGLVVGKPQEVVERVRERTGGWGGGPTASARHPSHHRALVKVQDGCNYRCSYCIVPQVRGPEQPRTPQEIVQEITQRLAEGHQEVVLTGAQIGSYRWDGMALAGLVREALAHTPLPQLRLTSLHPADLSPDLLSLAADPRLCPHFHLPLQSASDPVLQRMGRRYTAEEFRQAVAAIRQVLPLAAITTDVMVGFPGETEEDFEATFRFCQGIGFARLHIFPYSPRPGTIAAEMPPVPERAKRQRRDQMLALAQASARSYQGKFLGQTLPALWEKEIAPGVWTGLTNNYLRVQAQSPRPLAGQIAPLEVMGWTQEGLWGKLSDAPREYN